MEGPPEASEDHIIFGVTDGSHLRLRPSTASRRLSHALVRPMSRKDVFYAGSVTQLAAEMAVNTTKNR